MTILSAGHSPQPYGQRSVARSFYPVKASVADLSKALSSPRSPAHASRRRRGRGRLHRRLRPHDQLGGATDGAKRISVLTDQDLPLHRGLPRSDGRRRRYGTRRSSRRRPHGRHRRTRRDAASRRASFDGIEDDGRVKVFVGAIRAVGGSLNERRRSARRSPTSPRRPSSAQGDTRVYLLAGTMSQGETVTLGTTGAVLGDIIRIVRTSTSAQTLAVVNGGAGAGTLATSSLSKIGFVAGLVRRHQLALRRLLRHLI
jgi:hypothetical protein